VAPPETARSGGGRRSFRAAVSPRGRDVIEVTGGWDDRQLQRGKRGQRRLRALLDAGKGAHGHARHDRRAQGSVNDRRTPVGWPEFMFNRLRLAYVHFGPQRLGRRGRQPAELSGLRARRWRWSPTAISPSAAGNCARCACGTMTGFANDSISSGRHGNVTQPKERSECEEEGREEKGDEEEGGEESGAKEEDREKEGREKPRRRSVRRARAQRRRARRHRPVPSTTTAIDRRPPSAARAQRARATDGGPF